MHGQSSSNTYYANSYQKLSESVVKHFQDPPQFTNFYGKREQTLFFYGGHYGA